MNKAVEFELNLLADI